MRRTEITCDRCRQPVAEGAAVAKVEGVGALHDLAAVGLCGDCARAFRDWIRRGGGPGPSACLEREPFHP